MDQGDKRSESGEDRRRIPECDPVRTRTQYVRSNDLQV